MPATAKAAAPSSAPSAQRAAAPQAGPGLPGIAGVYIARCATQDGTDLGAYLVENGLALAAPTVADYAALETAARAADAGAWEGIFMPPWQWRAQ
jgi:hypothetical protein